jgi:hypothetical protein
MLTVVAITAIILSISLLVALSFRLLMAYCRTVRERRRLSEEPSAALRAAVIAMHNRRRAQRATSAPRRDPPPSYDDVVCDPPVFSIAIKEMQQGSSMLPPPYTELPLSSIAVHS